MRFYKYFLLIPLLLCGVHITSAQNQNADSSRIITDQDTVVVKTNINDNLASKDKESVKMKLHSPKKAAWMSALVPGLGQIYNKKYWKLPIIYVGFGVFSYLGYNYHTKFSKYKSTYLFRSDIDKSQTDYYPEITNPDILYQGMTNYRRNFELTCIFGSLFYVLNIIDASVDAHLYKFDISDDLSLKIEPGIINYTYSANNSPATGIKFSLHF